MDHLDFPEIYHNAGTNQLKAALSILGDKNKYPIEVIYKLNLRDGLSKTPEDLIKASINNFNEAVRKAPINHLSFINLAIAHLESDNKEEAYKNLRGIEDCRN